MWCSAQNMSARCSDERDQSYGYLGKVERLHYLSFDDSCLTMNDNGSMQFIAVALLAALLSSVRRHTIENKSDLPYLREQRVSNRSSSAAAD